jgi:outer membrane protein assembly factor BamB
LTFLISQQPSLIPFIQGVLRDFTSPLDVLVYKLLNSFVFGIPIDAFGTAPYLGPPTVANGVVFAESANPNFFSFLPCNFSDPAPFNQLACLFDVTLLSTSVDNMFAYDAQTGDLRWSFKSTGPVIAGPAVSDGVAYWGSLDIFNFGTTSTIFAFQP